MTIIDVEVLTKREIDALDLEGDDTFTPLVVQPLSEPMPGEDMVTPPQRRSKSWRLGFWRDDQAESEPYRGHKSCRNAGRKARRRK